MEGLHLLADLSECAASGLMRDWRAVRALCLRCVEASGLWPVGEAFHAFAGPDGRPLGVTGVVLLAESHLAVHTWPETRAVTADVYVCNFGEDNSARAEALMDGLVRAFAPARSQVRRVQRGQ